MFTISCKTYNHHCQRKQMHRNYFRITTALCHLTAIFIACIMQKQNSWMKCIRKQELVVRSHTGWLPTLETWKTWKSRGICRWLGKSRGNLGKVAEIVVCLWFTTAVASVVIRNTLDCHQSNYSSHTVFSHTPIAFGRTGNTGSAIRSADPENPTLEPTM